MTASRDPMESGGLPANVPLKGVNRALQVLEHVAVSPGRATDIAERLDISWATLHRTIKQLEEGGFVKKNVETNRYTVGPRMWFIGSTYVANHPVLEPARVYLNKAAQDSHGTVQLVERSGWQSTVLYNADTQETVTKAAVGYHFPLHAGSKGQVLLAHMPESEVAAYLATPLAQLTPQTEVDPERLRTLLDRIRTEGYSMTIADVQSFTASMSAPVFDAGDRVVAAVCFVTRKSAMQKDATRETLLELLLETSQNISVALGWRPNQPRGWCQTNSNASQPRQ